MDMPVEGAAVKTGDGRSFESDANGAVRFSVSDDGRPLSVYITYPGYKPERFSITGATKDRTVVSMRVEGTLENKELIFTAEKILEGAETKVGRSVSIAGRELARTAEIGFLEDVMTAVKLLPGVGYTNMFNAMPSIRGGDPGDLVASLDGFYIETPYFWGGGVSIFDPRMIQSVKLSHGIFSSRYGHTISGLLELTSKRASPHSEIELGISTSAVNLNVSLPFSKGGLIIMGKATYWDGYVALIKLLSNVVEDFEPIKSVTTAPYIRVASFTGNWNFSSNTELNYTGFIGADGVGANYENPVEIGGFVSDINMKFDWSTLQGFFIAGIKHNPRSNMIFKGTLGGGFNRTDVSGFFSDDIHLEKYNLLSQTYMDIDNTTWTAQGRADYDWQVNDSLLFAAGAEGLYNRWSKYQHLRGPSDIFMASYPGLSGPGYINTDVVINPVESASHGFLSAAYALWEYKSPSQKFGAEIGFRADHLLFTGEDFSIQTMPALNPRVNIDYNLIKNSGVLDSFDLTAGSGFFSSLTDNISSIQKSDGIDDFDLKQNRSWTTLLGAKAVLQSGWNITFETYYKQVFDRAYSISPDSLAGTGANRKTQYYFNGEGVIWGFDMMLQRLESQYWDGWISYTFNAARYHNPKMINSRGLIVEGDWRYPSFHRFHNLNIVLNIKPAKRYNISMRLGFASGTPLSEPGEITKYPVLVVREGESSFSIDKYKRSNVYSDTRRNGFSVPLDIKASFFTFSSTGKVQREIYIAVENALAFIKTRVSNTTYNQYTGTEVEGSDVANYQLPVPMISFGYTWSY